VINSDLVVNMPGKSIDVVSLTPSGWWRFVWA